MGVYPDKHSHDEAEQTHQHSLKGESVVDESTRELIERLKQRGIAQWGGVTSSQIGDPVHVENDALTKALLAERYEEA